MSCQSRDYSSSDGFLPIYYLGDSIKSGICSIDNRIKGLVGGRRKTKKTKKGRRKSRRKYR
jgi:hypothetical protein